MNDVTGDHVEMWKAEWSDLSAVDRAHIQLQARSDYITSGISEAALVVEETCGRTIGVLLQSWPYGVGSHANAILPGVGFEDILIIFNGSAFLISLGGVPTINKLELDPCCDCLIRCEDGLALHDHSKVATITPSGIHYFSFDDVDIDGLEARPGSKLIVKGFYNWGEPCEREIVMA